MAMAAVEGDRSRVLHIYNVENLYAAVVEGYVDWLVALVETVIRASVSGDTVMYFRGHEPCIRKLANLLHVASSYGQGRELQIEQVCVQSACGRSADSSRSPAAHRRPRRQSARLDPGRWDRWPGGERMGLPTPAAGTTCSKWPGSDRIMRTLGIPCPPVPRASGS